MQTSFKPGRPWLDTKGQRIQAHGGSMFYEDGWYYWYGEDKTYTRAEGKLWTWGVKCYRSKDLYNWDEVGHIVEPTPYDKKNVLHPDRHLERPHIIRNPGTGEYILWLKYNDKSHFAIMKAQKLLGPYEMVIPYFQPYGRKCGDFDLVLDEESGKGYFIGELDHTDVVICTLTEDFMGVTGEKTFPYAGLKPPLSREGITFFRHDGRCYLLTSGMIGYIPNPCEVAVADEIMGPYTVLGNPYVDDTSSAAYNSQPSCAFYVRGTDQLIVMGDRWVPDYVMTPQRYEMLFRAIHSRYDKSVKSSMKDKMDMMKSPMLRGVNTAVSEYVWLPVEFEGDMPVMHWTEEWSLKQ